MQDELSLSAIHEAAHITMKCCLQPKTCLGDDFTILSVSVLPDDGDRAGVLVDWPSEIASVLQSGRPSCSPLTKHANVIPRAIAFLKAPFEYCRGRNIPWDPGQFTHDFQQAYLIAGSADLSNATFTGNLVCAEHLARYHVLQPAFVEAVEFVTAQLLSAGALCDEGLQDVIRKATDILAKQLPT